MKRKIEQGNEKSTKFQKIDNNKKVEAKPKKFRKFSRLRKKEKKIEIKNILEGKKINLLEDFDNIGSKYKSFHNLNYTNFKIKKISAIAFNEDYSLLAVGKSDGSIEIYVSKDEHFSNWTLIKKFPGKLNTTVEKILWIGNRLYSAGLHSYITEWDFSTLSPKVFFFLNLEY